MVTIPRCLPSATRANSQTLQKIRPPFCAASWSGTSPANVSRGDRRADTFYPLYPQRLKLYTNGVYISRVNPSKTLSVPLYLATFAKAHGFQ